MELNLLPCSLLRGVGVNLSPFSCVMCVCVFVLNKEAHSICYYSTLSGVQSEVDRALMMIRKKFPLAQYPRLDMTSLAPPPPAPVVLPEVMQVGVHSCQQSLTFENVHDFSHMLQ